MPWKWKFPYKLYFNRAKVIIGVSDVICKEYQKRTGINIIKIPPLIPFQKSPELKENLRDRYKIARKRKIFLYVGSLKEIKRPDVIVKAIRIVGKEYLIKHNVLMLFAGDGTMKFELMQYCRKRRIR